MHSRSAVIWTESNDFPHCQERFRMSTNSTRRTICKAAGTALALIPIVGISRLANATTNAALRASLKYQDTPKDGMPCSVCLEFLPGKSEKGPGGCKVLPGDDEISPNGWCTRWNTM
jgi:hypothetical protein